MDRFLMISLLFTLSGCALRADKEEMIASLMDADRGFAKATAERGVDGWVAHFADHGVMLPAGRPLVRGRQAIADLMRPAFDSEGFSLLWEPTEADVSLSGELGYTLGRYERTAVDSDGSEVSSTGKYVTIWKRQADGSWRVIVDIGTPNQ